MVWINNEKLVIAFLLPDEVAILGFGWGRKGERMLKLEGKDNPDSTLHAKWSWTWA
jgi:hypothetical protein